MLPSDYRAIITNGIRALYWLDDELRGRAERYPAADAVWLSIRDVQGLTFRFGTHDDWTWQTGFADVMLSPQDLGVLADLAQQSETLISSRPGPGDAEGPDHAGDLRNLQAFLARYIAREFAFEDPEAYPNVESSGAAG